MHKKRWREYAFQLSDTYTKCSTLVRNHNILSGRNSSQTISQMLSTSKYWTVTFHQSHRETKQNFLPLTFCLISCVSKIKSTFVAQRPKSHVLACYLSVKHTSLKFFALKPIQTKFPWKINFPYSSDGQNFSPQNNRESMRKKLVC